MNFTVPLNAEPFFMQNAIQIKIDCINTTQKEILIALLNDEGYDGFEETETGLLAFINEDSFDEMQLKEIIHPFAGEYSKERIAPKNWNEEWEREYEPVVIDDFAVVRAHFHKPFEGFQHEIIVTPKMSFGTGHHATTWQMMKTMQQIDFRNKYVFDFGTGTGVLAILAEKLGAVNVLAIDNDDWSIENTIENLERNQSSKIRAVKADEPPASENFDIILANINRHILLQFMQEISNLLKPGGLVLMSGFYTNENKLLTDAASKFGLQLVHVSERLNWSSLMFQKIIS